jgi:hypothetical protein
MSHAIRIQAIKDSTCFVKIKSPDSFILTFLPNYPTDPNKRPSRSLFNSTFGLEFERRGRQMTATDRFLIHYLGLTFIECRRPETLETIESKYNTKFDPNQLLCEVSMPSHSAATGEEISDGTIVAQGAIGLSKNSCFSEEDRDLAHKTFTGTDIAIGSNISTSEYMLAFVGSITNAYSFALCRTIYSSLLQSISIDSSDIERSISACLETVIDIDMTPFLNALTLKRKSASADEFKYV